MSQAEELLNILSETVPEHTHSMSDSDNAFVIDPVTRTIQNMTGGPLILMQRDHKSSIYTFKLPRYIDGHDMSLCNRVKCHFNNIETNENTGETFEHADEVELTDLHVDPDDENSVICSWTIPRQATWYAGALGFLLQYLCVDDAGNETYEWHTDEFTDIVVKKRRNNDYVVLEYSAIFEQWRERIFGAGDSVKSELIALTDEKLAAVESEGTTWVEAVKSEGTTWVEAVKSEGTKQVESVNSTGAAQVEAISNEGLRVFNTIPEDYTAMSEQVGMLTSFAGPVIRQEAEGESIAVKDSAKMPLLGLQMFGKSSQKTTNGCQLFDADKLETRSLSNHTVTNNGDGSLTLSSTEETASENAGYFRDYTHEETLQLLKKAGTYTVTFGDATNPYFYVSLRNSNGTLTEVTNRNMTGGSREITEEMLADETSYLRLGVYISAGSTVKTGTVKPMMYIDGDGTWEEFSGGQPSPNPEYPQEIVSTGRIRNLFGGRVLADQITSLVHGTLDEINKTVKFDSSLSNFKVLYDGFEANKRYTVIFKGMNDATNSARANLRFTYTDGATQSLSFKKKGEYSNLVFVTPKSKSVQSFDFEFYGGNTTLLYEECGIFEGTIPEEHFTPYTGEPEFDLWIYGKNKIDMSKINVLTASETAPYISKVSENEVVITTPEGYTGNGYCSSLVKLRDLCPGLEVGKTYTLSGETDRYELNVYIVGVAVSWLYGNAVTITEDMLDANVVLYGFNGTIEGKTGNCTVRNLQIEEGIEVTEYEPFRPIQVLVNNTELPGLPVESNGNYVDENGQQYIADYRDWERGVDVRNTVLMDFGDWTNWNTWGVNANTEGITGFYHYVDHKFNRYEALSTIGKCSELVWGGKSVGVAVAVSNSKYIMVSVYNDMLADVSTDEKAKESFKALLAVSGGKMLASINPIETPIPEAELQAYRELRTNYPSTTILNDSGAYMKLAYATDTKTYIDNKFAELQAALTKES